MLGGASLPMASRGPPCWGGCGTLEQPPGPQSRVLELHPVPKHVHGKSGHPLHRRPWAQQQLAVWCSARESARQELPFVLDSGWGLPANSERRPSLPVGAGPWGFPLGLGVIVGAWVGVLSPVSTITPLVSAHSCPWCVAMFWGRPLEESCLQVLGCSGVGVREFSPISTSSWVEVPPPSNI